MAFKIKNPFRPQPTLSNQRTLGRDGRVISPVRQTDDDTREGTVLDYKDAVAMGDNLKFEDLSRIKDPRTAEEYDASISMQPNIEMSNPSLMDRGVKFLYDNPIIGKVASKYPLINEAYKGATKFMMGKSGGKGGGVSMNEIIENIKGGENYTGSDQVGWKSEGGPTLADQFLSSKDLFKIQDEAPKSDDYGWMKTYSLKGDEFDKGIDAVDTTSNYELYGRDGLIKPEALESDASNFDKRTYRENFPYALADVMRRTEAYDDRGDLKDSGYNPNKSMEENFKDLYKGKTFYGTGEENINLGRGYLGADMGGMRAGVSTKDNLPYMSVWDANDYQTLGKGGWLAKWEQNNPNATEQEKDQAKRGYMQAQLLSRASRDQGAAGGFKTYDQFFFTPDKYKDYISDEDKEFMQEFYGIHDAGGGMGSGSEPIVINATRKKK